MQKLQLKFVDRLKQIKELGAAVVTSDRVPCNQQMLSYFSV